KWLLSQVPRVLIVCFCSKKLNLRQLFSVDFEPSMIRILLEGQQFILGTKHFLRTGYSMTERIEQTYCIKFCQKLGDSQSEAIGKIQRVFGDDAMGWFKNDCTSVESDERPGRPQTARNAAVGSVRNLILEDRRLFHFENHQAFGKI
ncbi:hypothetical protein C0J52_20219, partial [Blattella germanica]